MSNILLPREAYGYAFKAGWVGAKPGHVIVAIGMAESDLKVDAKSLPNEDGSVDWSWLQYNDKRKKLTNGHPVDFERLLEDPLYAAICCFDLYKERGFSFTPWAAYTNERYLGPENNPLGYISRALDGQRNYFREQYGLPIR